MDDFGLLEELFKDKLIKGTEGEYGKHCIKLEEKSEENSYSITIRQTPEDAIAIKADSFPDLKEFFNCSSEIGQCKRSDFIIIADSKLIFIELSTTRKQKKEVEQQLQGAQCVIDYCCSISDKFYNHSLLTNYHPYFVSIFNIGTNKRSERLQKVNKNKTPQDFLRINASEHVEFRKLCNTKP